MIYSETNWGIIFSPMNRIIAAKKRISSHPNAILYTEQKKRLALLICMNCNYAYTIVAV